MTRLLVAGVGPLPPEQPEQLFAPGLRVWGIARELAREGHGVRLIVAQFGDAVSGEGAVYDLDPLSPDNLPPPRRERVGNLGWRGFISREAVQFRADAAVGTTDTMNHAIAAAELPIPFWADYFGDPMAERQMMGLANQSDGGLADQWALVAPVLARADRLSGCSREQCAAQRGQLAVVGRLNQFTALEALVHEVPPWIEPVEAYVPSTPKLPLLRGKAIPNDAFLVVQTGGFNTWLDEKSLFSALQTAMDANPRLHFATTGGAIPGHHESGYDRFSDTIRGSRHAARFHLLGWRPLADIPRLLSEADLAINLDLPCVEGRHGTRNRLMDWLLAGLPVVTTPGCELAEELAREGFVQLVPHDNPAETAASIARVAAAPDEFRAAAARGRQYLNHAHAPRTCLAPLLSWAADPKPASDLHCWRCGMGEPTALHTAAVHSAGLAQELEAEREQRLRLEREAAEMRGSRLVRWALRLRRRSSGRSAE